MYSAKHSVLCNGELLLFICSIQLFRFGQRICLQGFNSSETLLRATHVLEDVKINKYLSGRDGDFVSLLQGFRSGA